MNRILTLDESVIKSLKSKAAACHACVSGSGPSLRSSQLVPTINTNFYDSITTTPIFVMIKLEQNPHIDCPVKSNSGKF